MSSSWHTEHIQRGTVGVGVSLTQLTSAPLIHEMASPAEHAFTPDGRHAVYYRRRAPDHPSELWIADLSSLDLRMATDEPGAAAAAIGPDGKWLYYTVNRETVELRRLELQTFERETIGRIDTLLEVDGQGTVRHDGKAYVTAGRLREGQPAIIRFDLEAGGASVIFEGSGFCNAKPQYCKARPTDLLIQQDNRPALRSRQCDNASLSPHHAQLCVVGDTGDDKTALDLGKGDLEVIQGHQCWVGDEYLVVATIMQRETAGEAFNSDRIIALHPREQDRDVIATGREFCHVSVSADGKWWVADEIGTGNIFAGPMSEDTHVLVAESGASFGFPEYTQPNPAMAPDNCRIIYQSDATGIPQLYLAGLAPEFFENISAGARRAVDTTDYHTSGAEHKQDKGVLRMK